MVDEVALKVAGRRFEGWKSVSIDAGLDALAGSFTIGFTEQFPGHPERWVIAPGEACEVLVGGEKVMTGWIDRFDAAFDDRSHSVSISGREKTADLVDCSAMHRPGSWNGRKLEQIAADLARPFGIKVIAKASTGAVFSLALQQGESVFEAIDRMTRQRGVLATTNVAGDLELIRPGSVRGGYSLEQGVNIKAASFTNDVKDRFSQYTLKGQAGGGDFLLGTSARQPKAAAVDPGITRYRPLLIVNEDASSGASLGERARWEASVRAAKGQRVSVTVIGWRGPDGQLYAKNRLVKVVAPLIGVEADLLVASVRFARDDRGARTVLELARKEAFSLVALPAKTKKTKGKGVDPLIGLE